MKPLSANQLYNLAFVADGQIAPSATQAAVVVTRIKPETQEPVAQAAAYEQHIELIDFASGSGMALTHGPGDSKPRFSPDGTQLAFLRKVAGVAQLWLLPLSGGEARQATFLKTGITQFTWHPNGTRIAFTSRGDYEDSPAAEVQARVIDRFRFRVDGSGLVPTEPLRIWLLDPAAGSSDELQLETQSPAALTFSSDGNSLWFSAPSTRAADDEWLSGLWRLDLATNTAKQVLDDSHSVRGISPAPDGVSLALLAPAKLGDFAGPTGLWLWNGVELTLLSGELEASSSAIGDSRYGEYPNNPVWSTDGHSIYLNLNTRGCSHLASFTLDGQYTLLQDGERVVTSFTHAQGRFVFTAETPAQPGELFLLDQGKETRLTSHNEGFCSSFQLAPPPERRSLVTDEENGATVDYWLLTPLTPRDDHALVLQVHGGPHANYGQGFMFEFQLLTALGYTVVFSNPRGSSSYGTDFSKAVLGAYGTRDAADVLAVSRDARKHHSRPDAPLHLTGGSYGGFMTNWLVGQTDEFRSAATQRSICNFVSFHGTSDIGYRFTELELKGNAWADMELLWQQSPLKHVANVTTPMLVLHAEQDLRCPLEQAEQWFIALKQLDRSPVRFVLFPEENHDLSRSGRPDRRVKRLEELTAWFAQHA